ncbi:MAG: hypothetical protein ACJAZO_003278 [Myxococcota bacterium]|jgi:hypothetical protein
MFIAVLLAACTPAPSDDSADVGTEISRSPVEMSMIAFNVEGNESTTEGLAATVMDEVIGEAFWGLSEVPSRSFLVDLAAIASGDPDKPFEYVLGAGSFIRLAMLWDPAQLELISSYELQSIDVGDSGRAPLVGHFRAVDNGAEFLVVTNHFWRSQDRYRHEQGALMNQWATEQTLPAISLGDFNFDWVVEGGDDDHDLGYDNMVADGTWTWVRPEELIMTQCNFSYNSVLDFVFVAGEAQEWPASTEILNTNHSYCRDDDERSDHRAIRADFVIP